MNPKKLKSSDYNLIEFQAIHNYVSPHDLEEILETLEDTKCLNKKGKEFRHRFWQLFIEE